MATNFWASQATRIKSSVGSVPPTTSNSNTTTDGTTTTSNPEFARMRKYIESKYSFSSGATKNYIHIKRPKDGLSELMAQSEICKDFNINVLLCELFEQGFSVAVKTYLEAYIDSLTDFGKYYDYVTETKPKLK